MCIISGQVNKISDTNILVSKINDLVQLVVYSNQVRAENPVAMILPYPNKNVEPVIIETTKRDSKIFSDIDYQCFPNNTLGSYSFSNSATRSISRSVPLKIHRSGNYRYSIANSVEELNNVDPNVFKLNSEISLLLSSYSNSNFGFLVCIIDKNVEYTPFAYLCSTLNGNLFVPTKHYHEHVKNYHKYVNQFNTNDSEFANDWDHSIYIFKNDNVNSTNEILERGNYAFDVKDYYSFSKYLGKSINKNDIYKIEKTGYHRNIDIIV